MENITNSLNTDHLASADRISCDNNTESEVRFTVVSCDNSEMNSSEMTMVLDTTGFINDKQTSSNSLKNNAGIDSDRENLSELNSMLSECGLSNDQYAFSKNPAITESTEDVSKHEIPPAAEFAEAAVEQRLTADSENDAQSAKRYDSGLCYNWAEAPILLCSAVEEYEPTESCENFTKGCQWSPDGTCLLVASEDFRIRVYELPRELYSGNLSEEIILPPMKAALTVKEGGIIYDSCWFPMMNSWDPSTCCFATTSRESPVHLWDAFTGELRATYRAYNQVDEVEAAISVQFVNSGAEVWCGFKGALRTFDTGRPGRQVDTIYLKKDIPNVTGIVSCIRENPTMPGLVAFGTYSKTIGLYKDGPLCALTTSSGVTQIEFSPCGMKLYSAVRRNNEMLCWDLRNPGLVLYSIQGRKADTNQRIQFSVSPDGRDIVSGGTDGFLPVWQQDENIMCEENLEMKQKFKLSDDCVNGVNLHRALPILASCSGQRICDEENQRRDNSVRFWWCGSKR